MDKDNLEEEYIKDRKVLKTKFILITIIVAIIAAVASSEFTVYYYFKENSSIEKAEASENSEKNINAIADTLKNFRKVIDQTYIGEIDEQKMLDETIKGYVNGLGDEYSEYFTAEEWEEFETDALGNYVGIGVYIGGDKNNNIVILSPIKDTPAEEAGLQAGDVIINIDDENITGLSTEDVSSKIKGEAGTKVKLTVLRDDKFLDFEVERKDIQVYHVESKMLENNIGYISLLTFNEGCADELKNTYESLKSQGAKKIILDLRNNTGGLVDEALKIADFFVPKGNTTLITVDSKGNKEYSKSENDPIVVNSEVVVLVNEYSASASEILVGALRDNGIAKLVGTKTFGKGVIQSVFMLQDNSALKLTVNEYFTPNETKINKVGLEPDYAVEQNEDTEDDEQLNKAIEVLNQNK